MPWLREGDYPLDVHVVYFGEPEWQLERCLESILPHEVGVYLTLGGNNIGRARAEAFAACKAPLVGFVDPDDYLRAADPFGPSIAAYADPTVAATHTHYYEIGRTGDGVEYRHLIRKRDCTPARLCDDIWASMHLHLYRRAALAPHLHDLATWPLYEEAAAAAYCMKSGGAVRLVDDVPYYKSPSNNVAPMGELNRHWPDEWAKTRLRVILCEPDAPTRPKPIPAPKHPAWVARHNRAVRTGGRKGPQWA